MTSTPQKPSLSCTLAVSISKLCSKFDPLKKVGQPQKPQPAVELRVFLEGLAAEADALRPEPRASRTVALWTLGPSRSRISQWVGSGGSRTSEFCVLEWLSRMCVCVLVYVYIYIYLCVCVCLCVRTCVG